MELLREALGLDPSEQPFRWQERLLATLARGEVPAALDLPTGLGKTSVMALWLLARSQCPQLPRRLVYVVDRRAVVDQASRVADGLARFADRHRESLGLAGPLAISTLRGQHIDNRRWLDDPAAPAIIVGTIDMVGSRMLFSGYGVSRKMRPFHAGLLGADALVVIDEAHLVPPFEALLRALAQEAGVRSGLRRGDPVPGLKVLSMSATGRAARDTFALEPADVTGVVKQRYEAVKRLRIVQVTKDADLAARLGAGALDLAATHGPCRVVVFCDRRDDLQKVVKHLGKHPVETLVGARRVAERSQAWSALRNRGFIAGEPAAQEESVFLVATSAGEVGVDLDADHAVCDIVAWERMIQRLGRVNRRGDGAAQVVILATPRAAGQAAARLRVLEELPRDPAGLDASPRALHELKMRAAGDAPLRALLEEATTPPPLMPALSRATVDDWAMTSLRDHPGRPRVEPWIRGWTQDEPQTTVVWRALLPRRPDGTSLPKRDVERFFEAAPPHASEMLTTETRQVLTWLQECAARLQDSANVRTVPDQPVVGFVLDGPETLRCFVTLNELGKKLSPSESRALPARLSHGVLVVDAGIGGLSPAGMLDHGNVGPPATADGDSDGWDERCRDGSPVDMTAQRMIRFRVRTIRDDGADASDGTHAVAMPAAPWRVRARFALDREGDDTVTTWLVVEKWREDAAIEDDRGTGRLQGLQEHQEWARERARSIGQQLGLGKPYLEMLGLAARLHDEGKAAPRWQRAFNAPAGDVYAKTPHRPNQTILDGYRHELQSYLHALVNPEVAALPAEARDLALHLIASHHGFARPTIATDGCEGRPPSALLEDARAVAVRFDRLQRRWGPWGLAWWESLLRAADVQASRDNERVVDGPG